MVVDQAERENSVNRIFHALSDPTRRDIVARALEADHSVSALARGYSISLAAVQKHVAVLVQAELVTKHRRGREQIVRVEASALRRAHEALDRLEVVWRQRVDRIDEILTPDEGGPPCP